MPPRVSDLSRSEFLACGGSYYNGGFVGLLWVFHFCGSLILMGWRWTDFDELRWFWANWRQVVVRLILGFGNGGPMVAS